ncbi:YeiH family putative sulfate export transporter, partial [Salmonella enterica]
MTELTLQNHRRTMWHFIPGLALSAVITGVALWGGAIPAVAGAGFSALTLAILLGMVIGNTVYPQIWKQCDGGVLFAKQHLLRLGIILYGFRLTFSQIADVGISGIVIDVLTLSSTFMLACFLGQKVFGLDRHTSWLIGAGSSICGAAAVLATEPVVKAEASKVTVAVATVVIFGTIAIFLYPVMYPLLAHWFSPETYGIYIGSTMHEVAQVVAAGHAVSPDAENAAVIAKMLRVM